MVFYVADVLGRLDLLLQLGHRRPVGDDRILERQAPLAFQSQVLLQRAATRLQIDILLDGTSVVLLCSPSSSFHLSQPRETLNVEF